MTDARHPSLPHRAPPILFWRLYGVTAKAVECTVIATAPKLYTVTVVFGSETVLHECFPDVNSATTRALQVRERLLESGHWTLHAAAD